MGLLMVAAQILALFVAGNPANVTGLIVCSGISWWTFKGFKEPITVPAILTAEGEEKMAKMPKSRADAKAREEVGKVLDKCGLYLQDNDSDTIDIIGKAKELEAYKGLSPIATLMKALGKMPTLDTTDEKKRLEAEVRKSLGLERDRVYQIERDKSKYQRDAAAAQETNLKLQEYIIQQAVSAIVDDPFIEDQWTPEQAREIAIKGLREKGILPPAMEEPADIATEFEREDPELDDLI